MKKFNVVFCGTPDFSVPSLELLQNNPYINLKYVISMPDRPAGRGQKLQSPPVVDFAKANKIPVFQTENINKEEEFLSKLENENIDFFVVLAFAQFLGKRVLELPKQGCYNIHTSLLPKYRGAAPIQYALLNGDQGTGVSIQKMVKKMDAGDLVKDTPLAIDRAETGGQLYTRLKFQAALTLNDFILDLKNDEVSITSQNEDEVTFAPTLKKDDGHIIFNEENFETIWNKVRALKPWPGTFCFLNKKRLKVIEIEEYPTISLKAGEFKLHDKKILIGCLDKTIRLSYIQLEGKKACTDTELSNGLQNIVNDIIIS
jgi:methionyl-tRNA formyltransferase